MWKAINIDSYHTDLVGRIIRGPTPYQPVNTIEITAVGKASLLGYPISSNLAESFEDYTRGSTEYQYDLGEWLLWEQQPQKELLAPALYFGLSSRKWKLTDAVFSSRYDAEVYLIKNKIYLYSKIIWPAIPNKDGFYELPEAPNEG